MKNLAFIVIFIASFMSHAQDQGDAQAGKVKSAACVACHGVGGNSTLAMYPVLAGQHEKYLFKQLKEFKLAAETNGEQGRYNAVMAGMILPLSTQDMADIAAYFSSQTPKNATTPASSIGIGKALYLAGNKEKGVAACIACHGPRGNGSALSGFPKISGQSAQYIKTQLYAFRDEQRNNDLNAMMRTIAKKLSEKEIDAISQYVGGLH